MQTSADIVRVITLIAKELESLAIEFTSCAITLAHQRTRIFASVPHVEDILVGLKPLSFGPDTIERIEHDEAPIAIIDIPGAENRGVVTMSAPADSYYGQLPNLRESKILNRSDKELAEITNVWESHWDVRPWPETLMFRSSVRCPFDGGSISLSHTRPEYFQDRDARVLERFAEAFSLGYTRHLDFRHLEEQRRNAEIERALASVQAFVQGMKSSADIVRFITILSNELESAGMDFTTCAISFEDENKGDIRSFTTLPLQGVARFRRKRLVFGEQAMRAMEYETGPFIISGIPETTTRIVGCVTMPREVFYERQTKVEKTTIVSRSEAEVSRLARSFEKTWQICPWPEEYHIRTSLRAPFAGGVMAVNHHQPNAFRDSDEQTMSRFAEAFSLGYARYLDFRRLEEQNRELALERALEVIQNAVQTMRSSGDIVRVIGLLFPELENLDLQFTACVISLFDEAKGVVRSYSMFGADQTMMFDFQATVSFGGDTTARLENEKGPIAISNVPGAEGRLVTYITIPIDDYLSRHPRVSEPAVISMTQEQISRFVSLNGRRTTACESGRKSFISVRAYEHRLTGV